MRHGTATGYRYYGCRCDRCRAANTATQRNLRERMNAVLDQRLAEGRVHHGEAGTYFTYGCRCDLCRAAAARQRAAQRARLAAEEDR
jgi:hypothetical protein